MPQPVAVVCHDAGAANIILAEIQSAPEVNYLPVMQGPAAKLWLDNGRDPSAVVTLDTALLTARSVLTGTGWASDIEHVARQRAKAMGLISVALIDHWVNYDARFQRNDTRVLPDELWVTDEYAFEIASATFGGQAIRLLPNRYLDKQVQNIPPLSGLTTDQLLYVLEPLRFSWPGCNQPGEFVALDYFVKNLRKIESKHTLRIRLRPHPSDAADKYTAWLARNAEHNFTMDNSASLTDAIGGSEWVAGCETAAMVVALGAGRKVLSTLPPEAPRCRLPHSGIFHLRDL